MIENTNTEFKREYSDTISKSIVAFSNSSGGKIYIGIDNDGEIIGIDEPDKTCIKCQQLISDSIKPDVSLSSKITIEEIEDKKVVVISVNSGEKKPYYLRDKGLKPEGTYVRVGTTSIPSSEEVFYSLIQKTKIRYENQISFNQNLTFDYLKKIFKKTNIQFDEKHLEILHIKKNDEYTNLGFILSDQFDQPIKIASFPNKFKSSFIDRDILEGSVLEQLEKAIEFIHKHNRLSSKIEKIYRVDKYAYPPEAIREAAINAIIHRDYSVNSSILISIFPEEITFVSPGGLTIPYTNEELMMGVSALRNNNLANVFYRLKLIETYGSGLPRIAGEYKETINQPRIKASNTIFSLTLPAQDILPLNLKSNTFLIETMEFTREELQNELNMNKTEATKEINQLLSLNKIIKIGNGRSTRYRVIH